MGCTETLTQRTLDPASSEWVYQLSFIYEMAILI